MSSAGGSTPSGPRRAPFVAVVVALLAVGLVGQLLLNTALQRGSFELHELQSTRSDQVEERQRLEQELAQRESPAALAARARLLGMVASGTPVFLNLDAGAVQGTPTPAPAPPAPAPASTTSAPTTSPGA